MPGGSAGIGARYPRDVAKLLRLDFVGPMDKPRALADGSIRVPAFIARTGIQIYPQADGSVRREYRPPEEVFAPASLETWGGLTITDDHPSEGAITTDNWARLSVGHLADSVRKDGSFLAAEVVIKDQAVIAKVADGALTELSCGYYADLDMTPGVTPEGEAYDAIQRNIIGNHVAIGPQGWGRAGADVRLYGDSASGAQGMGYHADAMSTKAQPEIKTDNVSAPAAAPPAAAATVPLADYERVCAERDALSAKLATSTEAAAATVKADSDKRITASVGIRVAAVLVDDSLKAIAMDSTKTDREIMLAALVKVRPDFKGDGRSDDYVRASFDIACEGPSKAAATHADAQTVQSIVAARVAPASSADPVMDARAKMIERNRAALAGKGTK